MGMGMGWKGNVESHSCTSLLYRPLRRAVSCRDMLCGEINGLRLIIWRYVGEYFFSVRIIIEYWNSLPEDLLRCNTVETFNKKYELFLYQPELRFSASVKLMIKFQHRNKHTYLLQVACSLYKQRCVFLQHGCVKCRAWILRFGQRTVDSRTMFFRIWNEKVKKK